MGVLDILTTTSNALGSIVGIHSSTTYLTTHSPSNKKYPNEIYTHKQPYITLYSKATKGKVNVPILFYGDVTLNSVINIYSSEVLERTTYPDNGKFYANLYFSKPGIYIIYAVLAGIHESNEIYVTITP